MLFVELISILFTHFLSGIFLFFLLIYIYIYIYGCVFFFYLFFSGRFTLLIIAEESY